MLIFLGVVTVRQLDKNVLVLWKCVLKYLEVVCHGACSKMAGKSDTENERGNTDLASLRSGES